MKSKIFLPFLVLTLSSATAFSQRTLAPSLRPYAANWTYTLVQAMHRAGFDMPSGAKRPVAQARSGILQLDSTKTFYGYAPASSGDSLPIFRSTYQYPQAQVKIETNYQYDNGIPVPLNRATLTIDNQERLVDVLAEAFHPETGDFQPDSRLEIFPHGNSPELVDSFFTYLWDSTLLEWHLILANRNTFDAQDRLRESVSSLEYFGDPLIFKEIYAYDANGDNYLIEEFAMLGDDEYPSSRTDKMFYDHQPIEILVSVADSTGFVPANRTNLAYTLFGAVRRQLSFEWDTGKGSWRMFQAINYNYDNEQRLSTKETAIMPLNAAEEHELVAYAYLEAENLLEERYFHLDEELLDWAMDSKKFYYYAGLVSVDPHPGPAQNLSMSPNPTTRLVRLTLDEAATIRVFDASGQLVLSDSIQPDQPLDIVALPAGVYAITALQKNKYYYGKIVKQ